MAYRKNQFNSLIAINRKRLACFSRAVFHYSSAERRRGQSNAFETRENRAVFHARSIRITPSNLWKSAGIRLRKRARGPAKRRAAENNGKRNATCYTHALPRSSTRFSPSQRTDAYVSSRIN